MKKLLLLCCNLDKLTKFCAETQKSLQILNFHSAYLLISTLLNAQELLYKGEFLYL